MVDPSQDTVPAPGIARGLLAGGAVFLFVLGMVGGWVTRSQMKPDPVHYVHGKDEHLLEFTVTSTQPGHPEVDTLRFIDTLRSLRVPQMVGARIYYDAARRSIAVSVPQSSDVDADTLVELALVQLGPLRMCVIAEEDDPGYQAAIRDAKASAAGTKTAEGAAPAQRRRVSLCFRRPRPEFKSLAAGEFAELLDDVRRNEEAGNVWVYSEEPYSPDRGPVGEDKTYPYFELTGHITAIQARSFPDAQYFLCRLDDATADSFTSYLNRLIGRRVALVLGRIVAGQVTVLKEIAHPLKTLDSIRTENATKWGPWTLVDALNSCTFTAIRGAADISIRRRLDINWEPLR